MGTQVVREGARRMAPIVALLDVSPMSHDAFFQQAHTVARWLAFERTSLLYGRHLDVLVLCAVYGIAKANNLRQVTTPHFPTLLCTLPMTLRSHHAWQQQYVLECCHARQK